MKHIILIFLFTAYFNCSAQDTLYKRNGEILSTKILEISSTEIKYKRFNLQDGPLFISDKNEIRKIKYFNGTIDSFAVAKPAVQPAVTDPIIINSQQTIPPQCDLIRNPRGGIYYFNDTRLSEKRMLYLAIDKNRKWKSKELDKAIMATRDYKSNQYIAGFGGAALAVACLIAAGSSSNNNSNGTVAIGLSFNAMGIFIASQIVSPMFKRRRVQSARRVVQLFNEEAIK